MDYWTKDGPRPPVPSAQGRIVRFEDGKGWVVQFQRKADVRELRQDGDPTTAPDSWL